MSLSAMDIVKLFEEDIGARRRLAELLVEEHGVRLAIVNAVIGEVATKSNLEELRGEFREEIERLREEFRGEISKLEQRIDGLGKMVGGLEQCISGLEKRFDMMSKYMLTPNTSVLVTVIWVIGILLKMILTP